MFLAIRLYAKFVRINGNQPQKKSEKMCLVVCMFQVSFCRKEGGMQPTKKKCLRLCQVSGHSVD